MEKLSPEEIELRKNLFYRATIERYENKIAQYAHLDLGKSPIGEALDALKNIEDRYKKIQQEIAQIQKKADKNKKVIKLSDYNFLRT